MLDFDWGAMPISAFAFAVVLAAGMFAAAYLFGSISSAVIVCRALRLPDPRASGSNNPGATNVLRIGGRKAKLAAVITLLGDLLKGLLPVVAAEIISVQILGDANAGLDGRIAMLAQASAGAGAFLGHLYPLFFAFRGGKGVATAAGVFLAVSPVLGGLLILVWLAVALVSRYSSLAALCAAVCAPLLTQWVFPLPSGGAIFGMALLLAALLIWRHRANITRLLGGQESRIKLGGK